MRYQNIRGVVFINRLNCFIAEVEIDGWCEPLLNLKYLSKDVKKLMTVVSEPCIKTEITKNE